MYKCEICGRESFKKIKLYGYVLCNKHMHQIRKHGKFLDTNPRTNNDLNDYVIKDGLAYVNLYNQKNEYIDYFIVDAADIHKIKYKKWRFGHGHIVTGSGTGNIRELSHVILDIPKEKDSETVVDHISGDARDNTRKNLRICTQSDNVLNKKYMLTNTSGFIGCPFDKARNAWSPEICYMHIRRHLGRYKIKEEAVYARLVAEKYLFKDFLNENEKIRKEQFTQNLPEERKQEIQQKVLSKISDFGN